MAIQALHRLCDVSDLAAGNDLVDQIVMLQDPRNLRIDPDAVFGRSHFIETMGARLRNRLDCAVPRPAPPRQATASAGRVDRISEMTSNCSRYSG